MYLEALAKLGIDSAHPGGLSLTKDLIKTEGIKKETTILDVGCGTGFTTEYIYQKYQCAISACDLQPLMVAKANSRFQASRIPVTAIVANVESLPYSNHSFDLIICESVIGFTDIKKSLKELSRVLKPNGRLIAIEMCKGEDVTELEIKRFKEFYQLSKVFNMEDWRENLKNDFSKIEIHEFRPEIHSQGEMISMELLDQSDNYVYDIFLEHIELVQQFQQKVFPCIIKAEK